MIFLWQESSGGLQRIERGPPDMPFDKPSPKHGFGGGPCHTYQVYLHIEGLG
jgi:hypothetical protein